MGAGHSPTPSPPPRHIWPRLRCFCCSQLVCVGGTILCGQRHDCCCTSSGARDSPASEDSSPKRHVCRARGVPGSARTRSDESTSHGKGTAPAAQREVKPNGGCSGSESRSPEAADPLLLTVNPRHAAGREALVLTAEGRLADAG